MEIFDWYINEKDIDENNSQARIIQFEIEQQNPGPDFDICEIIRVHTMPKDCTADELRKAIEDYHELCLTDKQHYLESALQRLIK